MKKVILSMKRTKIVEDTDDYMHVEFKSAVLRFVDDVGFIFSDENISIRLITASLIILGGILLVLTGKQYLNQQETHS